MRTMALFSLLALFAVAAIAPSAAAQVELELPQISPLARVTQNVGYVEMSVEYSRPGVKGRKIWGGLVPYDELWRTGANAATKLELSDEATIAGTVVPAGMYSIFTIPTEDEWTVIINKVWDQGGTGSYDESEDVVRFQVKPSNVPHTEWMQFTFENLGTEKAELALRWEKLRIAIPIEVETINRALAHIREVMGNLEADDWVSGYRSASFALDNDVALEEAVGWAKVSIDRREHYLNYNVLSRLYAELDLMNDAIAAGEKAIELGKNAENPFDTRQAEANVAAWKKEMGKRRTN